MESDIFRVRQRERNKENKRHTYGLKKFKMPPQVKDLIPLKNDLLNLVKKFFLYIFKTNFKIN